MGYCQGNPCQALPLNLLELLPRSPFTGHIHVCTWRCHYKGIYAWGQGYSWKCDWMEVGPQRKCVGSDYKFQLNCLLTYKFSYLIWSDKVLLITILYFKSHCDLLLYVNGVEFLASAIVNSKWYLSAVALLWCCLRVFISTNFFIYLSGKVQVPLVYL